MHVLVGAHNTCVVHICTSSLHVYIVLACATGPLLQEDVHLLQKLGQFNREKVPERVVHARGRPQGFELAVLCMGWRPSDWRTSILGQCA